MIANLKLFSLSWAFTPKGPLANQHVPASCYLRRDVLSLVLSRTHADQRGHLPFVLGGYKEEHEHIGSDPGFSSWLCDLHTLCLWICFLVCKAPCRLVLRTDFGNTSTNLPGAWYSAASLPLQPSVCHWTVLVIKIPYVEFKRAILSPNWKQVESWAPNVRGTPSPSFWTWPSPAGITVALSWEAGVWGRWGWWTPAQPNRKRRKHD